MLFIVHDTLHYWNKLETPVGNLEVPRVTKGPHSHIILGTRCHQNIL